MLLPPTSPSAPHCAGVLPYHGDRLLVGREPRGWSPFSGHAERGETMAQTALREFHEETAGIFRGLAVALHEEACVCTVTPSGRLFALYLVELPVVDEHVNAVFRTHRACATRAVECEKLQLAWVKTATVYDLRLERMFRNDLPFVLERLHALRSVSAPESRIIPRGLRGPAHPLRARTLRPLAAAAQLRLPTQADLPPPPTRARSRLSDSSLWTTVPSSVATDAMPLAVGDIASVTGADDRTEVGTVVHTDPWIMRTSGVYVLIDPHATRIGYDRSAAPIPAPTLARILAYVDAQQQDRPTGADR